jgi:hypothetical protein
MSGSNGAKRFKMNPIEILVFSAISVVFANSVYNLFYGQQNIDVTATAAVPTAAATQESRSPASVTESSMNLQVRCGQKQEQVTDAPKIRLSGDLCDIQSLSEGQDLQIATIINGANKFTATVFAHGGTYSTDYIPLNTGKNPIQIEFQYRGGKKSTQDLTIVRNEAAHN